MKSANEVDQAFRDRIGPESLLREALGAEQQFLARHGDTQLLLVKLLPGMEALEIGLSGSDAGLSMRVQPSTRAMGLETQVLAREQLDAFELPDFSGELVRVERLRWMLRADRYFVIPLRKRTLDATFADRISVGRGTGKDIVLRHPSVSNFHAWFEMDDLASLFVADLDSTNATRVNGVKLEPRDLTRISSGDHLRIGSVECVPCDPSEFWRALRPA